MRYPTGLTIATAAALAAGAIATATPSFADEPVPGPPLHHVRYTVTADAPDGLRDAASQAGTRLL